MIKNFGENIFYFETKNSSFVAIYNSIDVYLIFFSSQVKYRFTSTSLTSIHNTHFQSIRPWTTLVWMEFLHEIFIKYLLFHPSLHFSFHSYLKKKNFIISNFWLTVQFFYYTLFTIFFKYFFYLRKYLEIIFWMVRLCLSIYFYSISPRACALWRLTKFKLKKNILWRSISDKMTGLYNIGYILEIKIIYLWKGTWKLMILLFNLSSKLK